MQEKIREAALQLIGLPLWDAGRAADLTWFCFGARRWVRGFFGDLKEVGRFALHVQCAWRIVQGESVIVGHRDMYCPPGDGTKSPDAPPGFKWDTPGSNRLDHRLKQLFQNPPGTLIVQRVEVGSAGALQIFFENEITLEIFPNDSFDEEHWRLFGTGRDDPHFVVEGKGALPEWAWPKDQTEFVN